MGVINWFKNLGGPSKAAIFEADIGEHQSRLKALLEKEFESYISRRDEDENINIHYNLNLISVERKSLHSDTLKLLNLSTLKTRFEREEKIPVLLITINYRRQRGVGFSTRAILNLQVIPGYNRKSKKKEPEYLVVAHAGSDFKNDVLADMKIKPIGGFLFIATLKQLDGKRIKDLKNGFFEYFG
ncbi:MAG TPA: hypothetical protein VJI98_04280 [Candidatus Nanoarchaeia archaeon]|nr:hypothetical protein [Candidatus Nanoarchaeia archaeon]